MPQPIPTAVGAEPFKVNFLGDDGKPASRTFADNAEAHRFRKSLVADEKGGLPKLGKEPVEAAPDADAPAVAVPAPPEPQKPGPQPVLAGMIGNSTPGPKTVTAPIPVVTVPDAAK